MFDCLGCAHRVVHPAPSSVVSALKKVQVRISIVPVEALERSQTVGRPPLDTDDLLDALLWLRDHQGPSDAPDDVVPVDDGSTSA